MLIYRKKHTHINIKAHRKHTLNYLFHIFTNNIILLDTVFFFLWQTKKKVSQNAKHTTKHFGSTWFSFIWRFMTLQSFALAIHGIGSPRPCSMRCKTLPHVFCIIRRSSHLIIGGVAPPTHLIPAQPHLVKFYGCKSDFLEDTFSIFSSLVQISLFSHNIQPCLYVISYRFIYFFTYSH